MTDNKGLAVFGGTFDPVHNGHVASALAIGKLLGIDDVVLVPCQVPPHRDSPSADPANRLEMLRLATEDYAGIRVDDRELEREGPSYTYDTLASFRCELGEESPLIFVLGLDAYVTLPSWYRWRELTELAHLLVLHRPGVPRDESVPKELNVWASNKECTDPGELLESAAGKILITTLVQVPVSATDVRRLRASGASIEELVPDEVNRYIKSEQLYLS